MAGARNLAIALLVFIACYADDVVAVRAKSKEEIWAHTTMHSAVETLGKMNHTASSRLVALVQEHVVHSATAKTQHHSLRTRRKHQLLRHSRSVRRAGLPPIGYDAVKPATEQINTMVFETQKKMDMDDATCEVNERKQKATLEAIRQDLAILNEQCARSRAIILKAQKNIDNLEVDELPSATKELRLTQERCAYDKGVAHQALEVIAVDVKVMQNVLDMITCGSGGLTLSTLQIGDSEQCKACLKQRMLGHLSKLTNSVTKSEVSAVLHEMRQEDEPGGFIGFMNDTGELPELPSRDLCQPSSSCSLSTSPVCEKLRDRFLFVNAGVLDKKTEYEEELARVEAACTIDIKNLQDQMITLENQLRQTQEDLASGTEALNAAELDSHLKNNQHSKMMKEYDLDRTKCCQDKNQALSEICALEKVRGELLKLEDLDMRIEDCQVSAWQDLECSATCNGGVMDRVRTVLVHSMYGAPCPPLTMREPCNEQPCPVDCELGDWTGWSDCDAPCGGGVMQKSREIARQPEYAGKPCDVTSMTSECNIQACSRDCELNDWTSWDPCSKGCDVGRQRSIRTVKRPATGQGKCPSRWSDKRVQYKKCNEVSCFAIASGTRILPNVLNCKSKVDVTILLDGSGSLDEDGWKRSVAAAKNVITALTNVNEAQNADSSDGARVALMVFSGPVTWQTYDTCAGMMTGTDTVDEQYLSDSCGLEWLAKFTDATSPSSLHSSLDAQAWPGKTTFTSGALFEATAEQINTRQDTNKVVLVFTDGKPMGECRTAKAAERLRGTGARLVFVPVGKDLPWKKFASWASKPWKENVVQVEDLSKLEDAAVLNSIISDVCPIVA